MCKPLHRYKGTLSVTHDNFTLEGQEVDSRHYVTFLFSLQEINEIHLGWDNTLKRWKDTRAHIKPLRITVENEKEIEILYLYVKSPDSKLYGEKTKNSTKFYRQNEID